MKVLAVLKFAVLLAEEPGEHLPRLHADSHHPSGLVPMSGVGGAASALVSGVTTFITVLYVVVVLHHFQPNLIEYAHEEVVHVVVYTD